GSGLGQCVEGAAVEGGRQDRKSVVQGRREAGGEGGREVVEAEREVGGEVFPGLDHGGEAAVEGVGQLAAERGSGLGQGVEGAAVEGGRQGGVELTHKRREAGGEAGREVVEPEGEVGGEVFPGLDHRGEAAVEGVGQLCAERGSGLGQCGQGTAVEGGR